MKIPREEIAARLESLDSNPALLCLYHNNPVVHQAVRLWAFGEATKEDAYESAMVRLAQQCSLLERQLVEAFTHNRTPYLLR